MQLHVIVILICVIVIDISKDTAS